MGPVVCRSVPCVGALATYDLPVRAPPAAPEWLVACISDAAKHLDQAPFLQLQLPGGVGRMQRHRVTHAVVQAPQARGSPETSAAGPSAAVLSLVPFGPWKLTVFVMEGWQAHTGLLCIAVCLHLWLIALADGEGSARSSGAASQSTWAGRRRRRLCWCTRSPSARSRPPRAPCR